MFFSKKKLLLLVTLILSAIVSPELKAESNQINEVLEEKNDLVEISEDENSDDSEEDSGDSEEESGDDSDEESDDTDIGTVTQNEQEMKARGIPNTSRKVNRKDLAPIRRGHNQI